MRRNRSICSVVLFTFIAVTLFAVNGLAASITVVNGDFEDLTTFTFNSASPVAEWAYSVPGWTVLESLEPQPYGGTDTLRMNDISVLDAFGLNMAAGKGGYIAQDLGMFNVGETVTLQVQVGRRTDRQGLGYSLQIWKGATMLNEFASATDGITGGTWEQKSVSAVIPDGVAGAVSIRLVTEDTYSSVATQTRDHQVNFDDVEVTAVPEPASMLLVGGGMVLAGLFGRKRLQK